jgi:membrane protease YdiL (CAAX protease family)
VWEVVRALLIWGVWQYPVFAFLTMPPGAALLWLAAVGGAFTWVYAQKVSPRRRAVLRIRPVPRPAVRWLAVMAPLMPVLALSMLVLLLALGLAQDEPWPEVLERYAARPGGSLVLLVVIVGVAPLTEEVCFRGWMQGPLERRFGARTAIAVTAAVFALAHLQPDGIPIRMAAGVALGWAVHATRSIWAGVALHVAWNLGLMLFASAFPDFEATDVSPTLALPAALALAAASAAAVWAGRRLAQAAREARRQQSRRPSPGS